MRADLDHRPSQLGWSEILSVWVKENGRWTLLTISNDPLTLKAGKPDFPGRCRHKQCAGARRGFRGSAEIQITLRCSASPRAPSPCVA